MKKYDENETITVEQEIIKQHEKQRIEKDRLIEEKRLSDERAKEYQKTQERLKKESEERRKKQRDNNKVAGRGSDIGTKTIAIGEGTIRGVGDSLKDIKRMREEMKEKKMEKKDYKTHEKQVNGKAQAFLKAHSSGKSHSIEKGGR